MEDYNRGRFYWCVKSPLAKDGEIYLHADAVRHREGALEFLQQKPDQPECVMVAFAPGQWKALFAASVIDGHFVSIEHFDEDHELAISDEDS